MSSPGGLSITARMPQVVTAAMRSLDLDVARALTMARLEPRQLEQPDGEVPYQCALDLLQAGVQLSGNPAFGLLAAEHYDVGTHVLEHVVLYSATVGEILDRVSRYFRLVNEAYELKMVVDGPDACMRMQPCAGVPFSQTMVEFMLAAPLAAARGRMSAMPVTVRLRRAAPAELGPYQRVLSPQLSFSAQHDEIVFDARGLALKLPGADKALLTVLDQHAEKLLSERPPVSTFSQRVRARLAEELEGGDTSIEHIASSLNMSTRTLRRRLNEEGVTHREVLDGLRRELALRYLDERVDILEIAFMLGFSNASNFHRAFKRWMDITPEEYRARLP